MSMKTELADMKERLIGMEKSIEDGDSAAIEEAMQLKADIETKEAEIVEAEKKAAILNDIGDMKSIKEENKEMEEKTGIQALNLMSLKDNRGSVSTFIKAASTVTGTTLNEYDRAVANPIPALGVRDLFGAESISGNALTYFVMGATEGAPAATNEGAAKPQIQPTYSPEQLRGHHRAGSVHRDAC